MPVLHERTGGDGYYVKGRLDDGFVTLQLIRPAVNLLTEQFGYGDGDKIPWKVMAPLCILDHAYSQTGGGPGGDATGNELSDGINKLSSSQQRYLRQYLESYEDYTPREREWVNTHVFDGTGAISRDQVSEFPESKQGPDVKVKRLTSIWKDVTEGRNQSGRSAAKSGGPLQSKERSHPSSQTGRTGRDQEANETSEDTATPIDPGVIEPGATLCVPVDRISNAGNVIVEIDGGEHLNLGDISHVESGDEVRVEIVSTPERGGLEAKYVPTSDSPE